MTEEERAAQFREDRTARCQAKCERLTALAGNPAARTALTLAWQPFSLWLLERDYMEADPDCLCSVPPYDPDLVLAN